MRMIRLGFLFAVCLCAAVVAAPAEDQLMVFGAPVDLRPGDAPQDVYGLGLNTSVIQVSQWQEVQSGITWQHPIPGYLNLTAGAFSPSLYAPIELDQGAQVTQVCLRAFDSSTTLQVALTVGGFESAGGAALPTFVAFEGVGTGTAAAPGYTLLCATVDPVITIRTNANLNGDAVTSTAQFWVGVTLPIGTTTAAGPAIVTWRRTISPAPAAATFTDVPTTHPFFRFVEAMAASGITGGCGAGIFCPDDPITRGQMSVFLAAALGLYWPN